MTRATGAVRGGTYRGVSAEERRAQRRQRLLDAALEIVGTQGWSAGTLRGICEQAKVGPRFFYESFADTDELLGALHDELLDTALGEALGAMAGAPVELRVRTEVAFQAMIRYLTDDPRRARVLFSEAYGSETLMRRRFAAMQTISATVLEASRELLGLPAQHERVLNAVSLLVSGGVTELVLGWLNGGLGLDRDELIAISVEFALTIGEAVESMTRRISPPAAP
ncbi:MAG TPA: TetR/AcrR family transcriptional regulator [Pseudonocardia sp.]|jgi:AcrR family transcriptional regulator|nr:TetR/AcrR family transcriptional regulator [Pseudonocardia sp.]